MGRTDYSEVAKKAIRKRTYMSSALIFIAMPLTLWASVSLLGNTRYMITSLLVVIYTMLPFFMIFENRKPKAREVVLIAMMTAITVCSHMFLHITIPLQIGTAMVIISGICLGPEAGFLVGALSRFVCNFYMGQGPWTPWQMFCWGLLGFLAGLCFNKIDYSKLVNFKRTEEVKSREFTIILGPVMTIMAAIIVAYVSFLLIPTSEGTFWGWRVYAFGAIGLLLGTLLQRKRLPIDSITLSVFAFFTTVIIYGGIMNMAMMFYSGGIPGAGGISLSTLRTLYISGLPYDISHGVAAALCIFIIGQPMIKKIERIKIKYGIYR